MNKTIAILALVIIVLIAVVAVVYLYTSQPYPGNGPQATTTISGLQNLTQNTNSTNSEFVNSSLNGTQENSTINNPLFTNTSQDENYSVLSQQNVTPSP